MTSGSPLFSLRGICKDFPDNVCALCDINLEISEGECILVAGANGSGKTVLMRIIAGLSSPSSGTLYFRGGELKRPGKGMAALRASLGIVFQDPDSQFVGETVLDDAAFGPGNLGLDEARAKEAAEKALACVNLADKCSLPPRRLSGGEKRRLALAGILAMGQDIIIMDEPFANLDWPSVKSVSAIIRQLKESGKTLLILTHELEKIIHVAQRLVILHRGRIVLDGAPENVLDSLKDEYAVRDPRSSLWY